MSNDNRVTIRLSKEQYFLYEMRAAAKGMRVSTYVKSLLDECESSSSNQLAELLRLFKSLDEKTSLITEVLMAQKDEKPAHTESGAVDNLSLEMLLMLRAMAKPEQLKWHMLGCARRIFLFSICRITNLQIRSIS